MEFSHELALALVQSVEPFPVDFEQGWRWIGYSTKQKAKNKLTNNFEEKIDFLTKWVKTPTGGRPSELIRLTIDCFKALAMMAGTERGKEIRRYFLECERIAKKAAEVIPAQTQEIERLKLELELARARESAARSEDAAAQSQQRLLAVSQAIATLHGSGMVALILGKPDATIRPPA
jgi:phage anti-repressor protein